MNNKFQCVWIYICEMAKLFMVFIRKIPSVVSSSVEWLPRFSPNHTHSFHILRIYTKIVTFIYWIYVIKGGDRLTTIWFNTVNICILLDDFKWYKQSLQLEAVASFRRTKNILIKWSGCTWSIPNGLVIHVYYACVCMRTFTIYHIHMDGPNW